ncbi:DUF4785 domain-containing protein [Legionella cardiaca]|uniref:DUF4785 family protein n=1 Tax=Legionella cardiaca TaxID=1071983 RepID=A0ABY8APX1_9GAMM|nr:DUF4785 domain-containing protein [Legionella cardiaca]WED41821.1 DUF4785 family protein [Legionella cardiaca]
MKSSHLIFLTTTLWFTQLQAISLPTQPIISYDCKQCENLSHDDLNSSWTTDEGALKEEIVHKQISRNYQIKASLQQLHNGISIYTQAPGALIRITSANSTVSSSPNLYIRNSQGKQFSVQEASSLLSKDTALKNTPFAGQLLAFQLKPELGSGKFIINSTDNSANANEGPYIIHVYDKDAATYLSLETDKARYHYGDKLNVTIRLSDDELNYPIDYINANVINPSGEIMPLNLEQVSNNLYQAQFDLVSDKNVLGENWYVAVETSTLLGDETITRQAHTAFSYVIPSATIRKIRATDKPLSFSAKVEVATGSRYALEAILFGSDSAGKLHPITAVQSASWLSPGKHTINFSFDSDLKTDYKAPYYLGYLHLIDFGQLKPVYEYNTPIELTTLG